MVGKGLTPTSHSSPEYLSKLLPSDVFESYIRSDLSAEEQVRLCRIEYPYDVVHQYIARLVDPIWNFPLFTTACSLTLSNTLLDRCRVGLKRIQAYLEMHYHLALPIPLTDNPVMVSAYLLVRRLIDMFGLCSHVISYRFTNF